jgi:hypothetical protein
VLDLDVIKLALRNDVDVNRGATRPTAPLSPSPGCRSERPAQARTYQVTGELLDRPRYGV